jgi:uncharacterized membrane protein YhaH (DUF805 family)
MPQSQLTEPASNETYTPKFFALNGRIGRVRYLGYSVGAGLLLMPVMFLLMGGAGMFSAMSGGADAAAGLGIVSMLAIYALTGAATIILARRRLHDLGKNGWLSLVMLIPLIGFFFWLWLIFGPGDVQSNEYGPPPGPNSTGVIILACILPLFFVIGIVAAIAIPAYSGYADKARAAQLENSQ